MDEINFNYMMILCPNDYRMLDLSDVALSAEVILVGIRSGPAHVLYERLRYMFHVLEQHTKVVLLKNDQEVLSGYGYAYHVFFDYTPLWNNAYLLELSSQRPSHLMSFNRLNSGDYFMKDHERPFFMRYPEYKKALVDISIIQHLYPYIAIMSPYLYLPTIQEQRF
jgi:hypothetical protein